MMEILLVGAYEQGDVAIELFEKCCKSMPCNDESLACSDEFSFLSVGKYVFLGVVFFVGHLCATGAATPRIKQVQFVLTQPSFILRTMGSCCSCMGGVRAGVLRKPLGVEFPQPSWKPTRGGTDATNVGASKRLHFGPFMCTPRRPPPTKWNHAIWPGSGSELNDDIVVLMG